ncbi:MAG: hypothetical protein ACXIVQ_00060 [Acidimicrobiales bacterium]
MSPASSAPVPGWWQRSWPLVGIGLLSIAMWTGRIRNVLADESLVGLGRTVRLVLAVSFVLGGVVVLSACWAGSRARNWRTTTYFHDGEWRVGPGVPAWGRNAATALAGWTVAVWTVQGVGILLDPNHDAGFKAIHTVLMVGSLVVAGVALWGARRSWSVASPSRAG